HPHWHVSMLARALAGQSARFGQLSGFAGSCAFAVNSERDPCRRKEKHDQTRFPSRKESRMAKARMAMGLTGGMLILGATALWAAQTPTVAQMLNIKPRQDGVVCSTPSPEDQKGCKVEMVKGGRGSGWLLRDKTGQPLRRFFDTGGDYKIWSYYKEGAEVYRE